MGFSGKGGRRARFGLGPTAAMLAAARRSPDSQRTPLPPPGIGHNQGPPLASTTWNAYCWRRAHKAAWKAPPIEVVRQRSRRADQLGLTYQEYTAHLLDRGTHLCALLFTLIGTLIRRTGAGIGAELADGFRVLPGVIEKLPRAKGLKVFVLADLTVRTPQASDLRQADSLVERLNHLCDNVITKHDVCTDPREGTKESERTLAGPATRLLRVNGQSPAATLMVGSTEQDKHCADTARFGMFQSAERFFGWRAGG